MGKKDSGYILLHRRFLDWEWYADRNVKDLFIHLILKANWCDKKWKGEVIHRGELVTSLEHLSKETGLSFQQTRTAIDKLKSTNDITYTGTPNYSKIKVNNYDKYQDYNKVNNKRITNDQQTDNKRLTTTNTYNTLNTYKYKGGDLNKISEERQRWLEKEREKMLESFNEKAL